MFKTIVIGADGSERADRALAVAEQMARDTSAKLVIAHVAEETVGRSGAHPVHAGEEEVVDAIGKEADRLRASGLEASTQTAPQVLGAVGTKLAHIAADAGADLIVIGTRGHSGMTGALLGSVAHKLLSVAHVPVLVVPDPMQEPIKDDTESSSAVAG
jgi:nucleotide-binding universal stress UspA family protein